jgi:hypothetical protein
MPPESRPSDCSVLRTETAERVISYWQALTTATAVGDALDVTGFGTFVK